MLEEQERKFIASEYLKNTDYMIIKAFETSTTVPEKILTKRAQCREIVFRPIKHIVEDSGFYETTDIDEALTILRDVNPIYNPTITE